MKTKGSILVIVLVAALLASMVGMASAVGSQTWYLNDNDYRTIVPPAHFDMIKGSGEGSHHTDGPIVAGSDYEIWTADQAAQCNVDMSGTWDVTIEILTENANEPVDFYARIGWIDTSTDKFHVKASAHCSESSPVAQRRVWTDTITTGSGFTIDQDDYLAIEMDNTGSQTFRVCVVNPSGDLSPSFIESPTTDPGYPVPELSTLALFSVGLLALVGYVGYRRRRI